MYAVDRDSLLGWKWSHHMHEEVDRDPIFDGGGSGSSYAALDRDPLTGSHNGSPTCWGGDIGSPIGADMESLSCEGVMDQDPQLHMCVNITAPHVIHVVRGRVGRNRAQHYSGTHDQ